MAKRTTTANDTETLLGSLVQKVSPAELRIHLPRYAVVRERAAYEITAVTRGLTISWAGDTIAEAAREGLEYLQTPTEDPWRSCWKRTSRMQREFVRHILHTHAAEQTTRAIAAKMKGDVAESRLAFDLADALYAAVAEIDHEDVDEQGTLLPVERLEAEPLDGATPRIKPITPRTKRRTAT